MPSAYLLVSHGSRDPRPQIAMEQLARLVSQSTARMAASDLALWNYGMSPHPPISLVAPQMWEPVVGTACLELSTEPLHEQIKKFGDRAVGSGCNRLQIVPLFLLPGMHVMEDIPSSVAIAQKTLGQELKIDLRPHLGTHPGLEHILATQMAASAASCWILLAHGSRRTGSKQPVEAMAKRLGSQEAYWAMPPRLESRVKELVGAGYEKIGILPYFLFAGGITDAIAQSVEQLKVEFPGTNLLLAEPLGASAQLADLIWDLVEK